MPMGKRAPSIRPIQAAAIRAVLMVFMRIALTSFLHIGEIRPRARAHESLRSGITAVELRNSAKASASESRRGRPPQTEAPPIRL